MTTSAPVLQTRSLSKTFPGQQALVDVDFAVAPSEIHALLGENGSGKSTLIKILAGIYTADPGSTVLVAGRELPLGSPRDSHEFGLRFVHQALGIIDELTAVENIALGFGYRRGRARTIDWRAQRRKTKDLLSRIDADFDIELPAIHLRPVDRTAIAIARALDDDLGQPQLLVLDEPTAALPPHEVEALFALVRQARDQGTSVIYVSHRIDEILQLADRASVLRDGVLEGTEVVQSVGRERLIELIVGGEAPSTPRSEPERASSPAPQPTRPTTRPALAVRGLSGQRLDAVEFDLAHGEILGVAGLTGSGREELATALVGASPATGRLGDDQGRWIEDPTPRRAQAFGVVLVLPNRSAGAAAGELSIRENVVVPAQRRYGRAGFVSKRRERKDAWKWIDALDVRPRDPERAYALLSGGNQQKVVFAKWLNVNPRVMVLDDPTSGVDVGARQVIYDLIRSRAAEGVGFVVCSSDAEDLVAVCDRVLVLDDGRICHELVGAQITEASLATAMVSGHDPAGASAPDSVGARP
jgi:ribose transport system ATP-binding protein